MKERGSRGGAAAGEGRRTKPAVKPMARELEVWGLLRKEEWRARSFVCARRCFEAGMASCGVDLRAVTSRAVWKRSGVVRDLVDDNEMATLTELRSSTRYVEEKAGTGREID